MLMRGRFKFVNIDDYKVVKATERRSLAGMDTAPGSLPGGSRERILSLLLHAPEPLSIPVLAGKLGISRNATHLHVNSLERDGLVERAAQISTGGRPSQGFQLSAAGEGLFPRQYALLARKLIGELARFLGPEALPGALARIGEEVAKELASKIATSGEATVPAIATLMRDLGYEAHLTGTDGEEEIEAHNCVFHDLAMRDEAICAVDLALLGTLSGRVVEHRRCMARGERSCRFAFGRPQEHG
jgi:predicted ArsR family transcriptional regulator